MSTARSTVRAGLDAVVSARRDAKAARRFLEQVIGATRVTPVTTDQASVYPALEELLPAAWHRAGRYANNGVEADHGRLKSRLLEP